MKTTIWNINNSFSTIRLETDIGGFTYDYNPDLMMLLLNKNRLLSSEYDFVFYHNLIDRSGSVRLSEKLYKNWYYYRGYVNFDTIPQEVDRILFFINIFDAASCCAHFGKCDYVGYQLFGSYSKLERNNDDWSSILYRKVEMDLYGATLLELGYLERDGNKWDFVIDEERHEIELVDYIIKNAGFAIE